MLTKRKLKRKGKNHIFHFNLNLLFLIVFFSFIALISRLAYIQLVQRETSLLRSYNVQGQPLLKISSAWIDLR